ncbi:MAG: L,D-transpeptidase family protein [Chloroflexi bacterium]|nr:L,D-transpeptidase family protein [Chloroflexota bacterium]
MADEPDNPVTSEASSNPLMNEGIALARAGQHAAARDIFRRLIHQNPDNEDAWLWFAWVAESRAHSLRYLREAQALLPDSQRIEEAVAWASQDAAVQVGAQEAPAHGPGAMQRQPTLRGTGSGSAPGGARPQRLINTPPAVEEAVGRAKARLHAIKLPQVSAERLRSLSMPVTAVLSVVALVLLVLLGIRLAREASPTVLALALPTVAPDATATPSPQQVCEPLWTQAKIAMSQTNWDAAVTVLQRIREINPTDSEARRTLATVHYERGVRLVQSNELDAARFEFDAAVRLDASYEPLQEVRRQLKLYTDGVAAYWAKDWPVAVSNLKKAYALNPDFRDCKSMLAQAYQELAAERYEQQVWEDAKEAIDASLALAPDRAEAQELHTMIMDALIPPKRIVVDLGDQTVTVYENHAVIYKWRCCTGRSTAPTVPGRYAIQSKLPSAYASKWDLDMPYWLGIYWAGGSENGFHAVPLLNGRQVLWRSSMGTPCSFGCIVLDTDDAMTLYDWAEMGVAVIVEW